MEDANRSALEATQKLLDIEEIKGLKARYFRLLDQKKWDQWRELFCEDFRGLYKGDHPDIHFNSRDELVDVNRQMLDHKTPTVHHGHTPEIERIDATRARGTWAMEDYVGLANGAFRGWGHYEDEYAKIDGEWKIRSTTLTRLMVVAAQSGGKGE